MLHRKQEQPMTEGKRWVYDTIVVYTFQAGANCQSDVWSLGCLLFELLTGEFMFFEQDWVYFFMRVTNPSQVCFYCFANYNLRN